MKKILYLMHVPWGWIKQRPHFIAEHLSKYYKVNVFCKKAYNKKNLIKNNIIGNVNVNEVFRLPFERFNLISKFNTITIGFQLKRIINNFELVWITHPNLFELIQDILPGGIKLIYDCMDDAMEFPSVKSNSILRKKVFNNEEKLVKRSSIIFVSSEHLKWKLIDRYKITKKIYVLNNAIFLDEIDYYLQCKIPMYVEEIFKKVKFSLSYIGTISDWLDINILLKSLDQFKEITYMIFGPSKIKLPKHDRLIFFGPIEHKCIFNIMKKSDVLIMPFKKNELTLSVDPVKLYEYIFSCKPSIAIEYNETLKFKEYVYLYKDSKSYFKLLDHLINGDLPPKKNYKECYTFVLNNTWEKRINDIRKLID